LDDWLNPSGESPLISPTMQAAANTFRVTRQVEIVHLTPSEFELLAFANAASRGSGHASQTGLPPFLYQNLV
jgi:hypothetical protein